MTLWVLSFIWYNVNYPCRINKRNLFQIMECRDEKHYSVQYETGDIVFTCIGAALATDIHCHSAGATMLGLLVISNGDDYLVAESRVPLSTVTMLSPFIQRSADNVRFVACGGLTVGEQKLAIMEQAFPPG